MIEVHLDPESAWGKGVSAMTPCVRKPSRDVPAYGNPPETLTPVASNSPEPAAGRPALYANDVTGALACREHVGATARGSIDAHPRRRNHPGIDGMWSRAEWHELAQAFLDAGLPMPACETCGMS